MPQMPDSLPPPAVEWRRESDEERKQRLERAGVLQPPAAAQSGAEAGKRSLPESTPAIERFKQQVESFKQKAKKSYLLWWTADMARWSALRSPTNTRTLGDGSYTLGAELTHSDWNIGDSRFSFGPRAFFYNGAQYAKLSDPFFTGDGFATFSSSELGLAANFSYSGDEAESGLRGLWVVGFAYTPVRWVSAETKSSAPMIPRSDTFSRMGINLPGLGFQAEFGADWNSLIRFGVFAGVHGAWPFQVRLRTGVRLSMGMAIDAQPVAER